MITIGTRDELEQRMDADEMLAEMNKEVDEYNDKPKDIDFRSYEMIENCIHGVSRLYLCPYCETIWEEEMNGRRLYEQFCESYESDKGDQTEGSS